jgi:hypothetical protein
MDFDCVFAQLGGKERLSRIITIHLDGVVSEGSRQDMAYGAKNWQRMFAEQEDCPVKKSLAVAIRLHGPGLAISRLRFVVCPFVISEINFHCKYISAALPGILDNPKG